MRGSSKRVTNSLHILNRILKRTGKNFSPTFFREHSTEQHHEVVEGFMTEARKYDMNPTLKKEVELEESDIQDKDLVVSIGGDSTYLQSAGIITDSSIPLLGINSDPMIRTGFLANVSIESKFVHK